MELAQVAPDSRGARDRPDQAVVERRRAGDHADLLETIEKAARVAQHALELAHPAEDLLGLVGQATARVVREIRGQAAQLQQAEQIAMPAEFAAQAQQVLLDDRRLAGRHRERRGATDPGDRRRVMAQSLEFGKQCTQRARPRRHLDLGDRLDRLAEGEAVRKRGAPREALGEEQGVFRRLPFGDLLDAAVLVEEARQGDDHVLADGLEQEVRGFREIGVHRPDRHGEGARRLDDRGGCHRGSSSRMARGSPASNALRMGLTPSGHSSCRTNSPSFGCPSNASPNRSSASRSCQSAAWRRSLIEGTVMSARGWRRCTIAQPPPALP